MSCLPGMPCYNEVIYTNSQQGCGCCGVSTCSGQCGCNTKAHCGISSDDVTYVGPNLPHTGIQNLTDLTTAIEQIDEAIGGIQQLQGTSSMLRIVRNDLANVWMPGTKKLSSTRLNLKQ